MEIRYFKYSFYRYVARLDPSRPRRCTLWAESVKAWEDKVYLGSFEDGKISENEDIYTDLSIPWSVKNGAMRLYDAVAKGFAEDVERAYNAFVKKKKNMGRPTNVRAVKATASLIARNPGLSARDLAILLQGRLRRKKVDPKSAWRWRHAALLMGVAK